MKTAALTVVLLALHVSGCAPMWVGSHEVPETPATADSSFADVALEREFQQLLLRARWRHLRALDEMSVSRFEPARRELDMAFLTLATLQEGDPRIATELAPDEVPADPPRSFDQGESEADRLAAAVERTYFELLPNLERLSPDSPLAILLQGMSAERIEDLPDDASQIVRIHQLAPQCNIPIDANAHVAASIHFFQTKGRETYVTWIRRSGKYRDLIHEILKREGIPLDFLHLAMIESGFKPRAYSRAKAVGLWQFMLRTGRLEGLRRTHWVDERRDPVKSTRAAARHLKSLYAHFGDWRLAAAAYNCGKGRLSRAIEKAGTRNYWLLELPRETRNYLPLLMATTIMAKDPALFGFPELSFDAPDEVEPVRLSEEVHLPTAAKLLGMSYQDLRDLNPELRRRWTPPGQTYFLQVPAGRGSEFLRSYARLPDSRKPRVNEYVVSRGDNISTIAQTFAVSADVIAEANGLHNPNLIHPGQKLFIPVRGSAPKRVISSANLSPTAIHTVRRGESLSTIAGRYGVTVRALKSWNGLRGNLIHPGDELRMQVPRLTTREPSQPALTSPVRTVHTVRPGETLWELSRRYRIELSDLIAWNELADSTIRPGQKLVIAAPAGDGFEVYTVIEGDTLYSIARRFGTDVRDIARHNNMSLSTTLLTGMTLRVPSSQVD